MNEITQVGLDLAKRVYQVHAVNRAGYSERLAEAGVEPSVGSKGDSYDTQLKSHLNANLV